MNNNSNSIPNNSIFGAHYIVICIFPIRIDDGTLAYKAKYDIFLDDGTEMNAETTKLISIVTDIISDNKLEVIADAAISLEHAFSNIANEVIVLDEEGEVIEELKLDNNIFDVKSDEKSDEKSEQISLSSKSLLH